MRRYQRFHLVKEHRTGEQVEKRIGVTAVNIGADLRANAALLLFRAGINMHLGWLLGCWDGV